MDNYTFVIKVSFFFRLDEDIIYTDKKEYQMAVGYQNKIFINGLRATVDTIMNPVGVGNEVGVSAENETSAVEEVEVNGSSRKNETIHSSTDDEDSIDQNLVMEEYKNEMTGKVR